MILDFSQVECCSLMFNAEQPEYASDLHPRAAHTQLATQASKYCFCFPFGCLTRFKCMKGKYLCSKGNLRCVITDSVISQDLKHF